MFRRIILLQFKNIEVSEKTDEVVLAYPSGLKSAKGNSLKEMSL